MAQKTRNKNVKSAEMLEFILGFLKSNQGLQIKSKEICKEIQNEFNLNHPPSESLVRSIVHRLRMDYGYWQLNASNRGYSWDDSDKKYQAWKSMFQSQITTMIRCLHRMESSYVSDVNQYLKSQGFKPSTECRFDFFPLDLNWSGVSPILDNFMFKMATQPLNERQQKKFDALPDSKKRNLKYQKKKKKKNTDDKRGEFFRYVKSIRKEEESWKEAIVRAKNDRHRRVNAVFSIGKETRNNVQVDSRNKDGLWSRLSKNLLLTRDT